MHRTVAQCDQCGKQVDVADGFIQTRGVPSNPPEPWITTWTWSGKALHYCDTPCLVAWGKSKLPQDQVYQHMMVHSSWADIRENGAYWPATCDVCHKSAEPLHHDRIRVWEYEGEPGVFHLAHVRCLPKKEEQDASARLIHEAKRMVGGVSLASTPVQLFTTCVSAMEKIIEAVDLKLKEQDAG